MNREAVPAAGEKRGPDGDGRAAPGIRRSREQSHGPTSTDSGGGGSDSGGRSESERRGKIVGPGWAVFC
jgi:hypothetical protein